MKKVKFRLIESDSINHYHQPRIFHLQLKKWWGWASHYWYADGPGYAERGIECFDTAKEAIDEIYKIYWHKPDDDLILIPQPAIIY